MELWETRVEIPPDAAGPVETVLLEAGVVGALAGVRASVVSGGVLCVAGTIGLIALLPRFRRYRAA